MNGLRHGIIVILALILSGSWVFTSHAEDKKTELDLSVGSQVSFVFQTYELKDGTLSFEMNGIRCFIPNPPKFEVPKGIAPFLYDGQGTVRSVDAARKEVVLDGVSKIGFMGWDTHKIEQTRQNPGMLFARPEGKSFGGLTCWIRPTRPVFQVGEPIQVFLRLKNTGNDLLQFPETRWDIARFDSDLSYQVRSSKTGLHGWHSGFPLNVNGQILKGLKPGEEVEMLFPPGNEGGVRFKEPESGLMVSVELNIGNMSINNNPPVPEDYSGWTSSIYSKEVSVDVAAP